MGNNCPACAPCPQTASCPPTNQPVFLTISPDNQISNITSEITSSNGWYPATNMGIAYTESPTGTVGFTSPTGSVGYSVYVAYPKTPSSLQFSGTLSPSITQLIYLIPPPTPSSQPLVIVSYVKENISPLSITPASVFQIIFFAPSGSPVSISNLSSSSPENFIFNKRRIKKWYPFIIIFLLILICIQQINLNKYRRV